MKVYILLWQDKTVIGVYSMRELAEYTRDKYFFNKENIFIDEREVQTKKK